MKKYFSLILPIVLLFSTCILAFGSSYFKYFSSSLGITDYFPLLLLILLSIYTTIGVNSFENFFKELPAMKRATKIFRFEIFISFLVYLASIIALREKNIPYIQLDHMVKFSIFFLCAGYRWKTATKNLEQQ